MFAFDVSKVYKVEAIGGRGEGNNIGQSCKRIVKKR